MCIRLKSGIVFREIKIFNVKIILKRKLTSIKFPVIIWIHYQYLMISKKYNSMAFVKDYIYKHYNLKKLITILNCIRTVALIASGSKLHIE